MWIEEVRSQRPTSAEGVPASDNGPLGSLASQVNFSLCDSHRELVILLSQRRGHIVRDARSRRSCHSSLERAGDERLVTRVRALTVVCRQGTLESFLLIEK